MIGIVIVAHGGLGAEYLAAMEHVVGALSNARAISIAPDHSRDLKQAEICEAADAVDVGGGVAIVVDMFGASPSNLALKAGARADRRILYGANLPLLIKLAKSRHMNLDRAVEIACAAGRKYLDCHICAEPVKEE